MIVFLPLFSLKGVEGKTFRPLAYTVVMAMIGSLIYSLVVAPVLASLLMRRPKRDGSNASDRVVAALDRAYRPLLAFFVDHRRAAVALAMSLLFAGGLVLPQLGSEFTPTLQEGTLVLRLTMAPSIALTESTEVALRVERRLMELDEVVSVVTRIGRGEVGAHTDPVNSAEMYLLLEPRESSQRVQRRRLAKLADHPGHAVGIIDALAGVTPQVGKRLNGQVLLQHAFQGCFQFTGVYSYNLPCACGPCPNRQVDGRAYTAKSHKRQSRNEFLLRINDA